MCAAPAPSSPLSTSTTTSHSSLNPSDATAPPLTALQRFNQTMRNVQAAPKRILKEHEMPDYLEEMERVRKATEKFVLCDKAPHHWHSQEPALFSDLLKSHPRLSLHPHLEVRASLRLCRINLPCELGVFATEDLPSGVKVCFYSDNLVSASLVPPSKRSHAARMPATDMVLDGRPVASLYRRYSSSTVEGVEAICALDASEFLPLPIEGQEGVYARFQSAPKGCMINSNSGTNDKMKRLSSNVVRQLKKFQPIVPCLDDGKMYVYFTTQAIAKGEELLAHYGNNEEKKFGRTLHQKRLLTHVCLGNTTK